MYDHDEEPADPQEPPAYDWDAWEKNRFSGRGRWWIILSLATMAAMTLLWLQSDGQMIPWGPPR